MNLEETLEIIRETKKTERHATEVLHSQTLMISDLEHISVRLVASLKTLDNLKTVFMIGLTDWNGSDEERRKLVSKVEKLKRKMQDQLSNAKAEKSFKEKQERYSVEAVHTGVQGRPTKRIRVDQLEALLELGFSLVEIARLLGVSVSTVKRRKCDYGLQSQTERSKIDDADLDIAIKEISNRNPRLGIVMIQGELRTSGVWVPRERIKQALVRIDPVTVLFRKKKPVKRRQYKVDAPNSLWHIDANLKLAKKFRISIHGAIDGYSRKIIYIEACNDRRAETVKCLFLKAVSEHGWPSRIRTDKGGENCLVGRLMQERRTERNPNPHCVGSSVHNQRIERLWVDVRHCVNQLFIDMYDDLVSAGMFDKDNPVDVYCAQAVFTPIVRFQLQKFKDHWNNHSLSTENQKTPNQMFISGVMKRHGSGLAEVEGMMASSCSDDEDPPLWNSDIDEDENDQILPCRDDFSIPDEKKTGGTGSTRTCW